MKAPSYVPAVRSPRWRRVLTKLATGDDLTTLDLMRVAGCVNAGSLLYAMRRRLGVRIAPTMRPHIDRDGRRGRVAVYSMTAAERDVARAALSKERP